MDYQIKDQIDIKNKSTRYDIQSVITKKAPVRED
jgi:hypothetical protein